MREGYHREQLISILQRAYSGELAAGYAYRGHWKSLNDAVERGRIQQIENEEWVHRERVGLMLDAFNASPRKGLEFKMRVIGRAVGAACHVIGRFLPMYFAGRLESGNVHEYESAAFHAGELGLRQLQSDLLVMAEVERGHESFFMSMVSGHSRLPLMQSIFAWGPPRPVAAQEAEIKPAPPPIN
jgi:demethoxyubiquinone hydroxylase (CLK1/Coq7/Cat5 family)